MSFGRAQSICGPSAGRPGPTNDKEVTVTANTRSPRTARRIVVLAAAISVVLPVGSASAGRIIATGHDADHHCGRGEKPAENGDIEYRQCNFFKVAVNFVRGGAPDPAKPVLVLDRGSLDAVAALDRVYGAGAVPRTVMAPRSNEFASTPITTDRYSAVVIASSAGDDKDTTPQDLNERTSAPDSEAVTRRAADLRAFFDAGGGILTGAGNTHGDDPGDPYYGFLPITVKGARVSYPFSLTDLGRSLGLFNSDANCCATHNVFEQPSSDSAFRAIDTDAAGRVVTLLADTPRFSGLGDAPITAGEVKEITQSLPSARQCVRRSTITIRLKRPKRLRFSRAKVYVNGKRVKRLTGRRITRPFKVRTPKSSTANVRIVIFTTGKRKLTIKRRYRTCV